MRHRENHGLDYLPKLDKSVRHAQTFESEPGQDDARLLQLQGFNPWAAPPNKAKMNASLAKLKFLFVMGRWRPKRASSGRNVASTTTRPGQIHTEVFRLANSCFA